MYCYICELLCCKRYERLEVLTAPFGEVFGKCCGVIMKDCRRFPCLFVCFPSNEIVCVAVFTFFVGYDSFPFVAIRCPRELIVYWLSCRAGPASELFRGNWSHVYNLGRARDGDIVAAGDSFNNFKGTTKQGRRRSFLSHRFDFDKVFGFEVYHVVGVAFVEIDG